MVVQGNDNTLSVTLEEMIYHCRAVARSQPRAHIVCDLPFMSYQVSVEQALRSAGRLLKEGGAEGVKLEGGLEMAPTVKALTQAGIPVMGHVGLTPQSVHQMGGFKVQGKNEESAAQLIDAAKALESAGAYSIVIEGVPAEVGRSVTASVAIPTIGIGAGIETDGQVLVCYDMLGLYRKMVPKFVKQFGQIGSSVLEATQDFVAAVQDREFPQAEHTFEPTLASVEENLSPYGVTPKGTKGSL